jgi:V/A-type H+-transporting ATPase subunit E
MEAKLELLIERIKKDGVEQAQQEAEQIIEAARKQAEDILEHARQKAAGFEEKASQKAEQFKQNAIKAVNQAKRDLLLTVRDKLIELFDSALKSQLQSELTGEFLGELIIRMSQNWKLQEEQTLELTISEEDKQKIQKSILSKIKKELKEKVVIKTSSNITKGFLIGIEGQEVHYDFSDESIWEALKELLNPALVEILEKNG